ncbi:glycosyltransferase family 4 protein [Tsukamurella paurometabola]|uniref:D-inositol-3-phosphate glycosyltransferase n=1 Tax=Tsukamurella paurometabola TaxID=2061 RepID=A0A3P8JYJ0_TSUPA|nr:glycosyltransferase family 4 protein [Tsukamurella paurometabola]UEA81357.1 glycosyltransferase family 4 protein [Tsukamurella paurometabola]VDR38339.1 D-inositol-3-phosphate glycosyltransferase [Tsukamurella paurometabola]
MSGRIAQSVRHRTDGYEFVERMYGAGAHGADAILAYDERTGVPALLTGRTPVAAGIGWLTTRANSRRVHRELAARALPRAGAVWAQCSAVLPVLQREWGLAASRMQFIPLGIDTDFYVEQAGSGTPGLVVSAGEDRFRDHATLIRAMAQVRARRPETHLELASGLPFDAPEGLVTVHTERLDGRIRDLYARASLVAIALHRTVTGSGLTVVLEAMASGRPVVVTDNPGVADYVEHGVTGLLVPPENPEALQAAIAELLADDDARIAMGRAAANRARERFTTDVMAEHLAAMLTSM